MSQSATPLPLRTAGWLTRQVRDLSKRILGVITVFTRL